MSQSPDSLTGSQGGSQPPPRKRRGRVRNDAAVRQALSAQESHSRDFWSVPAHAHGMSSLNTTNASPESASTDHLENQSYKRPRIQESSTSTDNDSGIVSPTAASGTQSVSKVISSESETHPVSDTNSHPSSEQNDTSEDHQQLAGATLPQSQEAPRPVSLHEPHFSQPPPQQSIVVDLTESTSEPESTQYIDNSSSDLEVLDVRQVSDSASSVNSTHHNSDIPLGTDSDSDSEYIQSSSQPRKNSRSLDQSSNNIATMRSASDHKGMTDKKSVGADKEPILSTSDSSRESSSRSDTPLLSQSHQTERIFIRFISQLPGDKQTGSIDLGLVESFYKLGAVIREPDWVVFFNGKKYNRSATPKQLGASVDRTVLDIEILTKHEAERRLEEQNKIELARFQAQTSGSDQGEDSGDEDGLSTVDKNNLPSDFNDPTDNGVQDDGWFPVSIHSKDGRPVHLSVNAASQFSKIAEFYRNTKNIAPDAPLRFVFDADPIDLTKTVGDYMLEPDDAIDAYF